jgi:hypothetical protein
MRWASRLRMVSIVANLASWGRLPISPASPQAFLHFELYNCGYNFPTVSNKPLTPVRTSFDTKSSSPDGTIADQILANDAILCGGIASTQWRVTLMKDQQTALQPTQPYFIATNDVWTPGTQPATQPPPMPILPTRVHSLS